MAVFLGLAEPERWDLPVRAVDFFAKIWLNTHSLGCGRLFVGYGIGMEDDLSQAEIEQMRKFAALQKVAFGILCKWSLVLSAMFIAMSIVFSVFLVWHFAKSGHRFDAKTQLLYSPRKCAHVDNMSDKQLMSILERLSLKRKVGAQLNLPAEERECLSIDLEITHDRKQSNLYTLTAHAPTWVGVVKKVNAYAETLIEEYIDYRKRDLAALRDSILIRKSTLQNHIAEIESEETIAKGKSGVASPVDTLTAINALLSDQRRNLSMLSVQITNEEIKRTKLEAEVGPIGKIVMANASFIRKKSEALAALDKDIASLRELYTDINPKVAGKLDDRRALLEEYNAFLLEKGMQNVAVEDLDRIEKAASDLADVMAKLDVLAESQRSLQQEIADNESKSQTLISVIPVLDRLKIKREDLERTMRDLEDQLDNIEYLELSVGSDLQQIERAGGAGDKNPLSIKNFALAIAGAFVCTMVVAFWILAFEFVLGKVRGAKELGAYGDVDILGSLPKEGALSADDEKDVLGVVALKLCNADLPKGVILVCRLPGSPHQPKFREVLEWSLTMAGQSYCVLTVVPSMGFTPPEGSESLINTFCKGPYCWFPVANRYSFAPTELQMLQADIATLREKFDGIFLLMPDGLRRGGSFFSQLLGVSESALLVVAADITPRSELEYVRRHVIESGKPMMGIVTCASAKVVLSEMEASK